jgi:hypothetical protein
MYEAIMPLLQSFRRSPLKSMARQLDRLNFFVAKLLHAFGSIMSPA